MASIELAGAGRSQGRRRIGFRLDMTPLVDVAFLLLTFFMFATTMSQPQVMEIRMPPDGPPVDVQRSRMLTILVRSDGALFRQHGDAAPAATTLGEIETIARQEIDRLGNAQLTVLRADGGADYGAVVAVLDRLNDVERWAEEELAKRAETRNRRFTIAPMSAEDREAIQDRYILQNSR
jgi:biopolymer transport protein ExbD